METVLQLWWRQRRHIGMINTSRKIIHQELEGLQIQPFEDELKKTEDFVDDEILVIQDIIWGERSTGNIIFLFP